MPRDPNVKKKVDCQFLSTPVGYKSDSCPVMVMADYRGGIAVIGDMQKKTTPLSVGSKGAVQDKKTNSIN